MPIDFVPAKYAIIANTLQARITTGAYAPGEMLPSEAQLVMEFAASRSTVVRALEYLRQLGYIEGVKGKGRMVLGPPLPSTSQPPARVRDALHSAEAAVAALVAAGRVPASDRIASTLAISAGEPVVARQRLMGRGHIDQQILSTVFVPVSSAGGTAFHATGLLREGALDHFERRRQVVAADVAEHLSVRQVSRREATLLALKADAAVLVSLLVARNAKGQPLIVFDLVIPVPPLGLEEIYRLR